MSYFIHPLQARTCCVDFTENISILAVTRPCLQKSAFNRRRLAGKTLISGIKIIHPNSGRLVATPDGRKF